MKVTARVLGLWQGNGLVTERLACCLPPATLENADSHCPYLVLTGAPTFWRLHFDRIELGAEQVLQAYRSYTGIC